MNFDNDFLWISGTKAPDPLKQDTLRQMKQLQRKRPGRIWIRAVLVAAVMIILSSLTVFSSDLFSGPDSDLLAFSSVYDGAGKVTVTVKNDSDKNLTFQNQVKLMQWKSGKEILPSAADKIRMSGTKVSAHSTGKVTIDLSDAYDISLLEQPLGAGDHYYLILTNNNFFWGQDWHCTVAFSEQDEETPPPAPITPVPRDEDTLSSVEESLRFYFDAETEDIDDWLKFSEDYIKAYEKLIAEQDARVVAPDNGLDLIVEPNDDSLFPADQEFVWGTMMAREDLRRRKIARKWEYGEAVGAYVENRPYPGSYYILPLFYNITYRKSDIRSQNDLAFIHGGLYSFRELEERKLYEDADYICYDITNLIYTAELDDYIDAYAKSNPDAVIDAKARKRIHAVYDYFQENLGDCIKRKPAE